METVRGIRALRRRYPRPVLAIGVFDGVHAGHRKIIETCVRTARRTGGTSVVLTFWPHPQKEESIYSLGHRLAILERLGVQVCVVVRFTAAFAAMSAPDFIKKVICGTVGARYVLVGSNFRFGRGLAGNTRLLAALSGQCGYRLKVFPITVIGGKPVSSTRIRKLIAGGRFGEAERLLARPVSVMGTVVGGRQVGRTLGYPTANIVPHHEVVPPDGIYAVRVLVRGRIIPGICYKGRRPTFGSGEPSIEVYLFCFKGDLYGSTVEVRFIRRLRGEKRFTSPAALSRAIARDICAAKRLLASTR